MWRIIKYRKTGEWRLYKGSLLVASGGWNRAQAEAALEERLARDRKATCPNCGIMVLGYGSRTIHNGAPALQCLCGLLYKDTGWEKPDGSPIVRLP